MKQHRTVIVMLVAVITAGIASYGVYQAIQNMPVREVEVGRFKVVVAVGTHPRRHASHQESSARSSPCRRATLCRAPLPIRRQLIDRGVVDTLARTSRSPPARWRWLESAPAFPL